MHLFSAAWIFAFQAFHVTRVAASCTPDQQCWPTISEWQNLNYSLNGHLQQTIPYAAPCFDETRIASHGFVDSSTIISNTSDPARCSSITSHYADVTGAKPVGPYREDVYGAMQFLNWEVSGDENCLLQSSNFSEPTTGRICSLGRLSPYYVDSRNVSNVQATVKFTKAHNLTLTIKNTGHDYVGRSSVKNSLALWTHNMNNLEFVPHFTATNCPAANSANVGIMGAGVIGTDAYDFFEAHGMQGTGGAVGSVGLAGGYGQGGGHGLFGPKYGLMVDQAVEFDVVTADGDFRTVNQCNDPDLFWALRGGGGSTYAVLVNYKFKVHPAAPIQAFSFGASFSPVTNLTSPNNTVRDIATALAKNQVAFSNANLSGYTFLYPDKVATVHYYPHSSNSSTTNISQYTSNWQSFLSTYPVLNITANQIYNFANYSEVIAYQGPRGVANTPDGYAERIAGRLIPRSHFADNTSIDTLVEAFLQGMVIQNLSPSQSSIPLAGQIYSTGPSNQPNNSATGVNPAWRGSLWEVVYSLAWEYEFPKDVQNEISGLVHRSMDPLRGLTPGGGCYMNEADVLEVDWQTAFFGSNYERLLEVKERYDPDGVFGCYKCVGWSGVDK